MQTVSCYKCHKLVWLTYKARFREECPYCQSDLHICLNCKFYDESAYNECKESSVEKVQDKEKNNRCEYFDPLSIKRANKAENKDELLKKAQALFKNL